MRYTKVNNQLIEKYTSLKIASTLPASGEAKEIVLVKGHGVYQYRTNTWVKVLNLEADVSSGFIGEIRPTIEATLGAEWLECDGSSYNTSTYPDLYALLGTATLPDLRECVLYGCGTNGTNPLKQYALFGVDGKHTKGHMHIFEGQHTHGIPSWVTGHKHRNFTYGKYYTYGSRYSGEITWTGIYTPYQFSGVNNMAMPILFETFSQTIDGGNVTVQGDCTIFSQMVFHNTTITDYNVDAADARVPRPNEFGVKYKIRAKI